MKREQWIQDRMNELLPTSYANVICVADQILQWQMPMLTNIQNNLRHENWAVIFVQSVLFSYCVYTTARVAQFMYGQ
jgi:hypothetical protein